MPNEPNLQRFFVDELRDVYHAEKLLMQADKDEEAEAETEEEEDEDEDEDEEEEEEDEEKDGKIGSGRRLKV